MAWRTEQLWAVMVTFVRASDDLGVLPEDAHGAVGWMGCRASDGQMARSRLAKSLAEIGLTLVEIGELRPLGSAKDALELDEELAANLETSTSPTTWGTLHVFLAEGEA